MSGRGSVQHPRSCPSARWPSSVLRTAPTGLPTAAPISAPTAPRVAALVPLCDSARGPEPKEDVTKDSGATPPVGGTVVEPARQRGGK